MTKWASAGSSTEKKAKRCSPTSCVTISLSVSAVTLAGGGAGGGETVAAPHGVAAASPTSQYSHRVFGSSV